VTEDAIVTLRRAPRAEVAQLDALSRAGFLPVQRVFSGSTPPPGATLTLPKTAPFTFAKRVSELASAGAIIETSADYAFQTVRAEELVADLDALPESAERFALSVGVRIGDETVSILPLLLAALREEIMGDEGALIVRLPDGRAVEVPAERLAPLRSLLLELSMERGTGEMSRVRALALDPEVFARTPKSLRTLRAALASPRRVAVPRTLRAKLREYPSSRPTPSSARSTPAPRAPSPPSSVSRSPARPWRTISVSCGA